MQRMCFHTPQQKTDANFFGSQRPSVQVKVTRATITESLNGTGGRSPKSLTVLETTLAHMINNWRLQIARNSKRGEASIADNATVMTENLGQSTYLVIIRADEES